MSGKTNELNVWTSGCCHVPTDLRSGYESLATAIRQSEFGDDCAEPFDWDFALHLGDFCGAQQSPHDEEGEQIVKQFKTLKKHRREQVYTLAGNHDASPYDQPEQWWFQKWIDPMGDNTEHSGVDAANYPYPIEGTWERYRFQVGNILFLMMSDLNNVEPPVGRGEYGGYPAGAVSKDTFDWWKRNVEENQDKIIVTCHHHMLKETTVGSGAWEGFEKVDEYGAWKGGYHGYYKGGGPEGASYLYFVDGNPDAQAFERYLAEHPGAIDLWIGGHTHTHPDDVRAGRSHVERKWDVNFLNTAGLTRRHGKTSMPISRLLSFVPGSTDLRIRCYAHTDQHAPVGWVDRAERTVSLRKAFE